MNTPRKMSSTLIGFIGGLCVGGLGPRGMGFVNVARLADAVTMLGAAAVVIVFLNLFHSYLLLVRFSAVDIMRRNVVEV